MKLLKYVKHESVSIEFVIHHEDIDAPTGSQEWKTAIVQALVDQKQFPTEGNYTVEINHHCYNDETRNHHMIMTANWLDPNAEQVIVEDAVTEENKAAEYDEAAVKNILNWLD